MVWYNFLEKFLSGFRVNNSTETALLKKNLYLNDCRKKYDAQKVTVLVIVGLG